MTVLRRNDSLLSVCCVGHVSATVCPSVRLSRLCRFYWRAGVAATTVQVNYVATNDLRRTQANQEAYTANRHRTQTSRRRCFFSSPKLKREVKLPVLLHPFNGRFFGGGSKPVTER